MNLRVTLFLFAIIFTSTTISGQEVNLEWLRLQESTGYSSMWKVHADDNGLYGCGLYSDSLYLSQGGSGGQYLTNGYNDCYLTSYDNGGNYLFSRVLGGPGYDAVANVHRDAAGNYYMIGGFTDAIDVDPGPGSHWLYTSSFSNTYFIKLSPAGALVWAKQLENAKTYDMAFAPDGSIFIHGMFESTVDFDMGAGIYSLTAASNKDVFLLKLDSNASFEWVHSFNFHSTYNHFKDIQLDDNGVIYLCGDFSGNSDMDPGAGTYTLSSNGNTDGFLLKLNADGTFNTAYQFGGADHVGVRSCAVDDSSNILVTGYFNGNVDFDPGSGQFVLNASASTSDFFYLKLNASGSFQWAKQLSSNSGEWGTRIRSDAIGNIYLAGVYYTALDVDPDTSTYMLPSTGTDQDFFVGKYTPTGDFLWAVPVYGGGTQEIMDIEIGPHNNVYFSGRCQYGLAIMHGSNIFATSVMANEDGFLGKLSQCDYTYSSIAPNECAPYVSPSGNYSWSVSGTYTDTLLNAAGCDSIITINLSIIPVDTAVTRHWGYFIASAPNASYQWLDCNSGYSPIPGATGKTFMPTSNGSYALEVTVNGCTDTSSCYTITNVGLAQIENRKLTVFPNPSDGLVNISLPVAMDHGTLSIRNMMGQLVLSKEVSGSEWQLEIPGDAGLYFITLQSEVEHYSARLLLK